MATSVQDYIDAAPEGAARVLQALAVAESLTDDVACQIYELTPVDGLLAEDFVSALHYADFISPRNSEWHFTSAAREELLGFMAVDPETLGEVHKVLLNIANTGDRSKARSVLPGYLFTKAGQAYHTASLGHVERAMQLYSSAAAGGLDGAQWLAVKLASEQEAKQIIPPGRIETTFLRAMVLFREGKYAEAEPLFGQVADRDEVRVEVAISSHILAGMIAGRNPNEAERFFRKSISMKRELNDVAGLAFSLHSLANLIGFRASDEAEALYRESIEIGRQIDNPYHLAQALHSLANLIGRNRDRSDEAEKLYRESIEIDRRLDNPHGVGQAMHGLANLVGRGRDRSDEAEALFRESIVIAREIDDPFGLAQRLHSLGIHLRRVPNKVEEAETILRESLKIGEELRNLRHQAQVLRTLSFVEEERKNYREAERLLVAALQLNERARDRNGARIVRRSLTQLRQRHGL